MKLIKGDNSAGHLDLPKGYGINVAYDTVEIGTFAEKTTEWPKLKIKVMSIEEYSGFIGFNRNGRGVLMEIMRGDIFLVCILSVVSSGVHLFYFGAVNFNMLKYYLPYIGSLHFLVFWGFSLTASTAF